MKTAPFIALVVSTVALAALPTSQITQEYHARMVAAPAQITVNAANFGEPSTTATPAAPAITAKAGFLLEANSGKILFAHNAEQRLPIASMTKVATLGVIYQALAQKQLQMDTPVLISERAASMGGSQAFLDAGSTYPAGELIKSIVVASANDSCVALAEQIAGSVENFVTQMNTFASNLGCQNTHFVNCTGLPATGAFSCAHDMALLYQEIMKSPHYADFNQIWMYDLTHPSGRVTGLTNTNKLIRHYPGCVGGKTGFTNQAGHCLTVAAKRDNLTPIAVIIGAPDSKTRFQEARNLLDYATQNFQNVKIVDSQTPLKTVKVKRATVATADVYPTADYYQLIPKNAQWNLTLANEFPETISAPVAANQPIGKVLVMEQGKVIAEVPVALRTDLPAATYWENVQKIVSKSPLA